MASGTPTGYANAGIQGTKLLANNTNTFGSNTSSVNAAAGAAGNVLGVYNGVQQGGALGYGSAGVNAANLATKGGYLGGTSGAVGSAVGYGAPILGIASGIKQGGVSGYTSAALNAYALEGQIASNTAASASAASTAGGSSAGAGAAAGIAGAIAPFVAIIGKMFMNPDDVMLKAPYWEGLTKSLQGNSSNVNTGPGGGGPDAQKYSVSDAVQEALSTPQDQVPQAIQQQVWATGLIPYGTWGHANTAPAPGVGGKAGGSDRRNYQQ